MKKIAALTLSIILLLSALPALAVGGAALPPFTVLLNGVTVDNEAREYPFLVYKDITYFPMTFYDCRFLGLETEWSAERGLEINKTDITSVYFPNPRENERRGFAAAEVPFKVAVNGRAIDNSSLEYPLLLINDVTYFPLTWELCHDEFGWDYSFGEGGLVINSGNIQFEKYELDIPDMKEYMYRDEPPMDSRYIAISDGKVYYLDDDGVYSYIPGETEPEFITKHITSIGSRLYSEDGNVYYGYMYPSERTSETILQLNAGSISINDGSNRWTTVGFSEKDGYILRWKQFANDKSYYLITPQGEEITVDENISYLEGDRMFTVRGGKLYYIHIHASSGSELYSLDLMTKEKTLLVENVSHIADADGDKIYFGIDGAVSVYDITTGEYRDIFHQAPQKYGFNQPMFTVSSIYALGDRAYCVNDAGELAIFKNENYTQEAYQYVVIGHESAKVRNVRRCGDGYIAFNFKDSSGNFTKTVVYDREGDEVLSLGLEVSELSIYDNVVMFFHDETGAVYRAKLK